MASPLDGSNNSADLPPHSAPPPNATNPRPRKSQGHQRKDHWHVVASAHDATGRSHQPDENDEKDEKGTHWRGQKTDETKPH